MIHLFIEQDHFILNYVDKMIKTYWFFRRSKERGESRIVGIKPSILLKKPHARIIRPSS